METIYLLLFNATIGLLIIGLGIPLLLEKIKPNYLYGFRTPKTLSDEKIWYAANKFAGKAMLITGAIISLLALILFLPGFSKIAYFLIWLITLLVPMAVMVWSCFNYLKKL